MNGRPGKWRRRLAALGLCSVAWLLGGCIYLRLLKLKHQLADFDRNFTLQIHDGLRLTCLDPILLAGDLRWLGLVPESATKLGRSEQWRVHWVKEASSNATQPEPAAHDIELAIDFTDNKFTGFFVAERYFAFIPKIFFVRLLRGLGGATVDKDDRRINASIALPASTAGRQRPTIASLEGLLGEPSEQRSEGRLRLLRYRYLPPTPGSNNGDFDLLFTFDSGSGELLRLHGSSPVGKVAFDFGPALETSPAGATSISPP